MLLLIRQINMWGEFYIINQEMSKEQVDRSRTMFLIPTPDEGSQKEVDKRAASFRKKTKNKLSGVKTCRNTDMHPFMFEAKSPTYSNKLFKNVFAENNQDKVHRSSLFQMKYELQNLGYWEKMTEIEKIIQQSKDLCEKYGYFNVTITMIRYHPQTKRKLSIWIHPDLKIKRPLHPIRKGTSFDQEIEFIVSLKNTLKQIFPTVDLGPGRTFFKLLYHIDQIKKNIDEEPYQQHFATPFLKKNLMQSKSGTINRKQDGRKLTNTLEIQKNEQNNKVLQKKSIKAEPQTSKNDNYLETPKRQSRSTLMSSMRTNKTCRNDQISEIKIPKNQYTLQKDILRNDSSKYFEISNEKIHSPGGQVQKNQRSKTIIKHYSLGGSHRGEKDNSEECSSAKATRKEEQQEDKHDQFEVNKKQVQTERRGVGSQSQVKRSRSGEVMTTSALLISELNNLFGGQEVSVGYYDGRNQQNKLKSSQIMHIQEDFEELFS